MGKLKVKVKVKAKPNKKRVKIKLPPHKPTPAADHPFKSSRMVGRSQWLAYREQLRDLDEYERRLTYSASN